MIDLSVEALPVWVCPKHMLQYGPGFIGSGACKVDWECTACLHEAARSESHLREERERFVHWMSHSGVPPRYRSAVPSSIEPINACAQILRNAVQSYCDDIRGCSESGTGMTLLGEPGLGKTLSLCAIVSAVCRVFSGPVYVSWPEVISDLKASFGQRDDPRRDAVRRLHRAPFLALDEITPARAASKFNNELLFELIDFRYRMKLPTLLAGNATPNELPRMLGERIADRLSEMGPVLWLTGPSQRGSIAIRGADALLDPSVNVRIQVHAHGRWRERTVHL